MAINRKRYKIIDILGLDPKLYRYNSSCNHPLLVAMRHLVYKTKSNELVADGKMSCGQIVKFIEAVDIYRAQFTGRALKRGQMQEKLLAKLNTFKNKNLFK